jgi:uracil-DNA glycosylase family 4
VREQIIQLLRDEARWTGSFLILTDPEVSTPLAAHAHIEAAHELELILKMVTECTSCGLCHTRKNVVFGQGKPGSQVMFIGEGPGAEEDQTGMPFMGAAGNLLSDIIEKGMGLKRPDVFITNILKCRPPADRDPLPDEVASCIGFLHAQIRAVNPKIIVVLGRIAAHTLLDDTTPISKLRGTFKEYQGVLAMPTYHPNYLLHNPSKKRDVWEDIKKVMEVLGIR